MLPTILRLRKLDRYSVHLAFKVLRYFITIQITVLTYAGSRSMHAVVRAPVKENIYVSHLNVYPSLTDMSTNGKRLFWLLKVVLLEVCVFS